MHYPLTSLARSKRGVCSKLAALLLEASEGWRNFGARKIEEYCSRSEECGGRKNRYDRYQSLMSFVHQKSHPNRDGFMIRDIWNDFGFRLVRVLHQADGAAEVAGLVVALSIQIG